MGTPEKLGKRPKSLVAILVFGDISTRRITRVLTQLDVDYRLVLPRETPDFRPTHIILSGSTHHVYEPDHYIMPEWVRTSPCPVLGVCYGMQLIAHTFGGTIVRMCDRERGAIQVTELLNDPTVKEVIKPRWMNHRDLVTSLPSQFQVTAVTSNNHIAAFTDYQKWWAVQYHPESKNHGDSSIFQRFLSN